MSGTDIAEPGQADPKRRSTRIYALVALLLVVVIAILAVILITRGRDKSETATPTVEAAATLSPTRPPSSIQTPADTPPPAEIAPSLIMTGTNDPLFDFVSAGARPSTEWTGFFGQVTDADGKPISGVPLIVWHADGALASPIVRTDADGNYEIRLADGILAGVWSIQVLTDDMRAASKLQTFRTDMSTETGIQNIQVLWQKVR